MQRQDTNAFDGQATSVMGGAEYAELRDMPPRTIQDFLAEGMDPTAATEARPGTEDKVRMLAARYEAGLPLWNTADCLDHSPRAGAGLDLSALAGMSSGDDLDEDEVEKETED